MFIYLITFVAGFIIALIIASIVHRVVSKNKTVAIEERLQQQVIINCHLKKEIQNLVSEKENLIASVSKAETKIGFLEEKLLQQKEEMNKIGESFKFEFKNLAQNILEEKTQKFTEVNEQKMKAILDPLKNELGVFKQKVEETYDKESKERFSRKRN